MNSHQIPDKEYSLSLLGYINILAKHSRFIVGGTMAVAVVSLIILFIITVRFTAAAYIMPPQTNTTMIDQFLKSMSGSTVASMVGGGAGGGAASLLGLKGAGDLYIGVLSSEPMLDRIIKIFNLREYYQPSISIGESKIEDIRKELSGNIKIKSGDEGVITVEVTDEDPQRAADMANAFVSELGKIIQEMSVEEATMRAKFLEDELVKVNSKLQQAEDNFEKFCKENNIVQPITQVTGILEYLGGLKTEIDRKSVQLQAMRQTQTSFNYEVMRAEAELKAMRKILREGEINTSPQTDKGNLFVPTSKVSELGVAYQRVMREVKLQEEVYKNIYQLLEIARMDKIKDAVIISVLGKATLPEKKSFPRRGLSLIVITILAGLIFMGVAFSRERWKKLQQEKPDEIDEIRQNLSFWIDKVAKLKEKIKKKRQ
jgi:capsule polysaccharide export protein KpsE/RkpR